MFSVSPSIFEHKLYDAISLYQSSLFLLPQDKEKGNDCEGTDQPINLSNQCTINGQTIIEHIIENILDEPMPQGN